MVSENCFQCSSANGYCGCRGTTPQSFDERIHGSRGCITDWVQMVPELTPIRHRARSNR